MPVFMSGQHPGEKEHSGSPYLDFYARHGGVLLLSDTVDVQQLPVRLRTSFANRPWPTHELGYKIVGHPYIPPALTDPSSKAWTMEIIDDDQIRINRVTKNVSGHKLELLNLLFLTYDWKLRTDEYTALGFASQTDEHLRSRIFGVTRKRLAGMMKPHTIFDSLERGVYRINPAVSIVDERW